MAREAKGEIPDAPPPRRNRADALAASAAPLGREAFARAGFREPALILHWDEIAGPDVARLCQPLKLSESSSGGVLTLKAEPGAALFLQHESRALCERINGYFGRPAIARLRFIQGPLATRPKPKSRLSAPGEVHSNDPALAYHGPENVREALLKLARRRTARTRPD